MPSRTTSRGVGIVAVKNVTVNEDYFQGHFPGRAAHAGRPDDRDARAGRDHAARVSRTGRPTGRAYLRGVDNAKFRRQVVPGDRLRLEVTLGARRSRLARAHAVAYIDDAVVAEAELVLGVLPDEGARETAGHACDPSAIVHPGAHIGAGTVSGRTPSSVSTCASAGLPDWCVERHRRQHGDRRRERDLPVRVGRADSPGSEVQRGADAPRHRAPERDPRVRDHPSRHRGWRRRHRGRRSQRLHGLRPRRPRLPRAATTRSSATRRRSAVT